MNRLFLVFLVLFSGCQEFPRFKVGDCFSVYYGDEKWEGRTYHYKVVTIGKTHYQTALFLTSSGVYWLLNSDLDSVLISETDSLGKLEKCLPETKQ